MPLGDLNFKIFVFKVYSLTLRAFGVLCIAFKIENENFKI
jgi:hypothetical protein